MNKGKLIVLYGANNLGKSTQVRLLEEYLKRKGQKVKRIKYPIYDLEPTGPIINAVLRKGKQMAEDALQTMYAQNRKDYESTLKEMLNDGTTVIAEDYIGTGIAWGLVRGLKITFLEKINKKLFPPDVSIMLYGTRFPTGREVTHRNEMDDTLWQNAAEKHDYLAERYCWDKVLANQTEEKVLKNIIKVLKKRNILL